MILSTALSDNNFTRFPAQYPNDGLLLFPGRSYTPWPLIPSLIRRIVGDGTSSMVTRGSTGSSPSSEGASIPVAAASSSWPHTSRSISLLSRSSASRSCVSSAWYSSDSSSTDIAPNRRGATSAHPLDDFGSARAPRMVTSHGNPDC